MSGKDVWRLRLIILRFMKEASPRQLLDVAEYAAKRMAD